MPDENSTLVTQTQQSSINQSGDDNDFSLDFGEGEAVQEIKDSNGLEDESLDENKDGETFESDIFDNREKNETENVGGKQEGNNEIGGDSDDFSLDFDGDESENQNDSESDEDNYATIEDEEKKESDGESSDIFQDGLDVTEEKKDATKDITEPEITDDELFVDNDDSETEKNEFTDADLFDDDKESGELPIDEEKQQDEIEGTGEEAESSQDLNMEDDSEESDSAGDTDNLIFDSNSSSEEQENQDETLNFDLELDENKTQIDDENKTDGELEGTDEEIGDVEKNDGLEDKVSDMESKDGDNLDFVMDYDPEEKVEDNVEDNVEEEQIKQPEIGDFLLDNSEDSSAEKLDETEGMQGDNVVGIDFSNINDVNEKSEINNENGSVEVKSDDNAETEVDSEGATLKKISWEAPAEVNLSKNSNEDESQDSSETLSQDIPNTDSSSAEENQENQNLGTNNNEDISGNNTLQESQVQEVNAIANDAVETQNVEISSDNNVKPVETPEMKATLSLDQILDSELNNNPQFADNSTAVPTNVQTNGGFFGGKKMVMVVIGVCILFGLVFVLAFPSGSSDRKLGDVVDEPLVQTGDSTHSSSPENPEDLGGDTSWNHSGSNQPTVVILGDEDTDSGDNGGGDTSGNASGPVPYISDEGDDEDIYEEDKISEDEILGKISSFKSTIEYYYSFGDEKQNKQLIRYAMQALNICDKYQAEVESGEGIDIETFNSFQSQVTSKISEMDALFGNTEEVEVFRQSNFRDEYYFTGKDENLQYIYENR